MTLGMRCLKRNSGCDSQSALRVCEQNGVWHMHTAHAVATSFYQASLFKRTETYMLDLQSAHDLQLTSVRMFVSNSYAMHCDAIPFETTASEHKAQHLHMSPCRAVMHVNSKQDPCAVRSGPPHLQVFWDCWLCGIAALPCACLH